MCNVESLEKQNYFQHQSWILNFLHRDLTRDKFLIVANQMFNHERKIL